MNIGTIDECEYTIKMWIWKHLCTNVNVPSIDIWMRICHWYECEYTIDIATNTNAPFMYECEYTIDIRVWIYH